MLPNRNCKLHTPTFLYVVVSSGLTMQSEPWVDRSISLSVFATYI